jgi:predicted RNA-binding protein with PUA-like domain
MPSTVHVWKCTFRFIYTDALMAHFLVKSEPSVYPWSQLVKDGRTAWDGVRNFEARNNLRAMKKNDLLLYYHSSEGKEIVGVAKVVREAYQDSTTDEDWSAVDVAPVKALRHPVTLAAVKAHPRLSKMALVKRSRISVVPVTLAEYEMVLELSARSPS